MSQRPWARAPSSGTTGFKELLLLSSGLNFLHTLSCHRIRRGRGSALCNGENRGALEPGWPCAGSGCRGRAGSMSRWFLWPGWVFLERLWVILGRAFCL